MQRDRGMFPMIGEKAPPIRLNFNSAAGNKIPLASHAGQGLMFDK
jgi:hypothetical protein